MPIIAPFAGLRYDLDVVGSLSDVIAPPYDVIDPALQAQLYDLHAANVVRVILNRPEPGDDEDAKYARAAEFFSRWQQEGILKRDPQPAFYVYNQQFQYDGQTILRRGFMGRVRLSKFGEGNIYPHEETHPKAKVDRLKLTKACGTNCSQIFGLYPDPENAAQELLERACDGVTPLSATDHLGVEHTMWPVSDPAVIAEVSELLRDKPMFVADGHHRYETACNYRDFLIEQQGPLPADHPANFVMTQLVSMNDPGMIVLPTHRLLRGTPQFSSDEIISRLGDLFTCQKLGQDVEAAAACWQRMESEDRQGLMAVFATGDSQWVLCDATEAATEAMRRVAPDHSEDWRGLGVSLLHRLVIDELLGAAGHPKPTYVHQVDEVIDGLRGEASLGENESDEPFSFAALVMPARVSDVEAISLHKERMPAKSTYFFPKLLSGLVFHTLR
ncbi:MAG: DUF1015 domain-containing protein [Planctomycetaceae bacterium]|nr:MAG: DUF1015 domain-containing protein [Planctomycetaceae bacterium]